LKFQCPLFPPYEDSPKQSRQTTGALPTPLSRKVLMGFPQTEQLTGLLTAMTNYLTFICNYILTNVECLTLRVIARSALN
jgi:hypothetical protein